MAKLEVPPGFAPFMVEFVDARHGFAMFAKHAEKRADAEIFRTIDGGMSWIKLAHPEPVAENQQMYVADPSTIVLLSEPNSWHVSKDAGATWKRLPYTHDGALPAEYPRGTDAGPYYLDYGPNYDGPFLIRNVGDSGFSSPVPTGYERAMLTNEDAGGRIWLTTVKDGHAATMVSRSGTRALTEVAVPKQPGRSLYHARVVIAPGGKDVWLLGDQEDVRASGGGTSMLRGSVLKGTGLPLVWKLEDNAWVPKPITGIQERPGWPYAVVPAGGGALLVAAQGQTGYVTDGFWQVPGMPDLDWAGQLRDGTIRGSVNRQGVAFLGEGKGTERSWVRVEVLALGS